MKHLRAILRILALCLVTISLYILWMAGIPFVFFSANTFRRWRNFNFRAWAQIVVFILGMRINLQGPSPRGSFFLVSNHLSYLDVVVLATRLNCVFIAKREVSHWPVIGFLCRRVNTIFIDRKHRRNILDVLTSIERSRTEGTGVVLFAEGTSTNGATVAPFKSSLLELAARKRIPVHYASLSYRTPPGQVPAHRSICWWGDMTFLNHLYGLFQLPEFEVDLIFGEQPIQEEDRKLLAKKLWSAVNAQFIPVVAHGGSPTVREGA